MHSVDNIKMMATISYQKHLRTQVSRFQTVRHDLHGPAQSTTKQHYTARRKILSDEFTLEVSCARMDSLKRDFIG